LGRSATAKKKPLYDELGIVKMLKIGRMRWLGHLFRMQELDPRRKVTVLKPDGTRRVGKRRLMWLGLVEEIVKNIGLRNWRRRSLDREE